MQKHNSKYKSDLKARCYAFSLNLIKLIDSFPNKRVYWVIGDQVLRSGTSIGVNLVEATASSSKRDFKRYHEIALKSANETKYWLSLLKDSHLVKIEVMLPLIKEATELSSMIAAGILKMKGKTKT